MVVGVKGWADGYSFSAFLLVTRDQKIVLKASRTSWKDAVHAVFIHLLSHEVELDSHHHESPRKVKRDRTNVIDSEPSILISLPTPCTIPSPEVHNERRGHFTSVSRQPNSLSGCPGHRFTQTSDCTGESSSIRKDCTTQGTVTISEGS